MDDNEKPPAPVVWGLLTLALELPEGEPEPEPTNVIYLSDYKKLH